ncbi:hypothetical protein ABY58_17050, partial [Edwardsiella ictaluri]
PLVAGDHANVAWREQCQSLPAAFIGSETKSVGQYTACFGVVRVPEPVLPGFIVQEASLLIEFADKRHISMGDK